MKYVTVIVLVFFSAIAYADPTTPSAEETSANALVQIGKLQQAYGSLWLQLLESQKALKECQSAAKIETPKK